MQLYVYVKDTVDEAGAGKESRRPEAPPPAGGTMLKTASLVIALTAAAAAPAHAYARVPVTLKGSPASMVRQNEVAHENALTFLRTPAQVQEFVAKGRLVPLGGNADYEMAKGAAFPFARPETRNFVEQFAPRYHEGCGTKLVITSATRPLDRQPPNAHKLSVHPTGMAVDMRVPRDKKCLRWLETSLLAMERAGELDATHEVHPQHFHVAVFPAEFRTPTTTPSLAPAAGGETTAATPPAAGTAAKADGTATPAARAEQPRDAQPPTWVTIAGIALSAGVLALILWHRPRRRDDEPTDLGSAPREHDRAA
jgi:hypothetical protein